MKRYLMIFAILVLTSCATVNQPVDMKPPETTRPMTPAESQTFWDAISTISIIWFTIL